MTFHLGAVSSNQIVFARGKQIFAISPRRADQRNSTCQRLKNPDGRDARKLIDVKSAWNMHGYAKAVEYLRHFIVRRPSGVLDAGIGECAQSGFRIADAVDTCFQTKVFERLDEKFTQFICALTITPI